MDNEVNEQKASDVLSNKDMDQNTVYHARSVASRSSTCSSVSLAAAKARAKAEAAKAKLEFHEKETHIQIEKAKLEASLRALTLQREVTAANAEAKVFEAVAADIEEGKYSEASERSPVAIRTLKRTEDYVKEQSSYFSQYNYKDEGARSHPPDTMPNAVNTQQYAASDEFKSLPIQADMTGGNIEQSPNFNSYHGGDTTHNVNVRTAVPTSNVNPGNPTFDLARFLARNQVITSGLVKFDDTAEHYQAWRASFINAIEPLGLTPSEEVDLMVKWLGKESSEHAARIRAVNVNQPVDGLKAIWARLDKIYGSPEAIENALFSRLEAFPKIQSRDNHKLQELADLLEELQIAKQSGKLCGLAYLDTARGVQPIVEKLPYPLQERWMSQGARFKKEYNVSFPPFSFFKEFVCSEAEVRNDPSFKTLSLTCVPQRKEKGAPVRHPVAVNKTNVTQDQISTPVKSTEKIPVNPEKQCPIHNKPHPLSKCRGFVKMTFDERKRLLKEHMICYRCCASTSHMAKNCQAPIKCLECASDKHVSAMHFSGTSTVQSSSQPPPHAEDGGEEETKQEISSNCTKVCGIGQSGKSCSKIILVNVYPSGQQQRSMRMYAVLDDQSNLSLARSEFFNKFDIHDSEAPYSITTCMGTTQAYGRRAHGYVIESLDNETCLQLPTLIECDNLPNNRKEIPTPEVVYHHKHLNKIASEIPPLDPKAEILLLIGRDLLRVHKVRKQINGRNNEPFAQKLDLGWVVVGDVCVNGMHGPPTVSSMKTYISDSGRPSTFLECENKIKVRDLYTERSDTLSVFSRTIHDHQLAPSIEDKRFLDIMEKGFLQDDSNSWVAPLPFRHPRRKLPNNREYAEKRFASLERNLQKKPEMKRHFFEFMQRLFDNHHAELALPLEEEKEKWYLPIFGVYHPQKPNQIRVVFDSSAQFDGISLNDVLLQGPDLNNSLLGVLMRFRIGPVAVLADIEQMFHCFVVREECRDMLRFLWYRDNQPGNEVVEYRMRVHIFGNSPSPAIAIYGLRRAAKEMEQIYGSKTTGLVERHFYMDDALLSFTSEAEATKTVEQLQEMLSISNLRLHKIASNCVNVINHFPADDRAKDIKDLDLFTDDLPVQRSLGVIWNLASDTFTFKVPENQKPFTRRGVLSTVNSLFDPLGFLAPIAIKGRMILRDITTENIEWDVPLPQSKYEEWRRWQESLSVLKNLHIPRTYVSFPVSQAKTIELCVFSDASVQAISAVAYLRITHDDGHHEVGYIFGKSKLAPQPELTVPRLELCAAVLAVEVAETIMHEIDIKLDAVRYFSDSKVVLGYIHNERRRFYVFVSNRVQRIRQVSQPNQWRFVPTELNPADCGSRSVAAEELVNTLWLTGPRFLTDMDSTKIGSDEQYLLINPDDDTEVRVNATNVVTESSTHKLFSSRFEHFSNWKSLLKAVARLIHIAQSFSNKNSNSCRGWHYCNNISSSEMDKAERLIIHTAQQQCFSQEISAVKKDQRLPKNSPILRLNPFIDNDGLLRVGGRLQHSMLQRNESNPIIIPNKHHIATLLVRHHHERVKHQGRHLTEGAVRTSGLWLVGGKRLISTIIHKCVFCRKLRGLSEQQLMSDLPEERLKMDPPFSYVGLDVFGPWEIVTKRTRGGQVNNKRWAVLFTCMSTRAIHIEIVETMTASSFINALRRFFSLRGPPKQLRSDRGTNFIGACSELKLSSQDVNNTIKDYLTEQRCTWEFNPPHASHMGGTWERMIGVSRRILDALLLDVKQPQLTHEVLVTFMAEVTAIVNARPLVPISTDPEAPLVLTPAMLLTQKTGAPPPVPDNLTEKDGYKSQWKRVQILANNFWTRWRKEYLCTLQGRQKWLVKKTNLKEGDVVLLKDSTAKRNEWPMGLVEKTYPSKDGLVRKVDVKVARHQGVKSFCRPISDLILLLSSSNVDV